MSNIELKKAYAPVVEALPEYAGREKMLQVITANVAKGTNATELSYFLGVCRSHGLDPLKKEIWCYKDNRGNLIIFAGRDGMLAKAQQHPRWNGMRSMEVCANDAFTIDVANAKINHSPNMKDRGAIIGAYAIVFLREGEPTIEYADFLTYKKGSAWSTHPAEMIKKVAEVHALKKAFGFSGLQTEYDYNVDSKGVASPIGSADVTDDTIKEMIVALLDEYGEVLGVNEDKYREALANNRAEHFPMMLRKLEEIKAYHLADAEEVETFEVNSHE